MFVFVRIKSNLLPNYFAICLIGWSVRYKCTEFSSPHPTPGSPGFENFHRAVFWTVLFYTELGEDSLNSICTATQVDKTAVCAVLTRISRIHRGKTGKSPGWPVLSVWVMRDRLPQHRLRQYWHWMSCQTRRRGQSLQVLACWMVILMVFFPSYRFSVHVADAFIRK